jgi:putative hemolysin
MMPLDELGKKLGIDFGEEPFDTANGFVISRLEHIPEEDEEFEFEYKGFLFRILEVGDKVIETITAKKMESQASQNNDGNIVEEVTQK